MKTLLREAWFLLIPGVLLLLAGGRDLLSSRDAPVTLGAGLAILAASFLFWKVPKLRGSVLVASAVGMALVFPVLIHSDRTYWAGSVVLLIFFAGAVCLSLTHRRV